MTKEKINSILMEYKKDLPAEKIHYLRAALEKADDQAYENIMICKTYSSATTLILSVLAGGIGIDRFYIGDIGMGVGKLLLGWVTFGIWPLIDMFCSYKVAKEKNLESIMACI